MSFEDKPVEDWSPEEYREFWQQFIEEQVIYRCVLCDAKIQGDVSTHMEQNHDEKYKEHNESLEDSKSEVSRPEPKLTERWEGL